MVSYNAEIQIRKLKRHNCTWLNNDVYEMYKPASGPISMEIIFIHGFQTEDREDAYLDTWMTSDGSTCWVNTWLVDHFPQAHILAVSYDSSILTFVSTGLVDMYCIRDNLVSSLVEVLGVGQACPVVMVGNCVGGLVLKEICFRASELGHRDGHLGLPYRNFLRSVEGTFFLSTAQCHPRTQSNQGVPRAEYLELLDSIVARFNSDFSSLVELYDWKTMPYGFTDHKIGSDLRLESSPVIGEAADRNDEFNFGTISVVDLFSICKPKDQTSNSFVLLVEFLKQISTEEEKRNGELQLRLRVPQRLIISSVRMETVRKSLDLQNPKIIWVSLVGMSGAGKSVLAKQTFLNIHRQFDYICFMDLEDASQGGREIDFDKVFTENLYEGNGRKFELREEAPDAWYLLGRKKVLIVLDDVRSEHTRLVPPRLEDICAEGSRFITTAGTTSCSNIFSRWNSKLESIEYVVPLLSEEESMEFLEAQVGSSMLQLLLKKSVLETVIVTECGGLPAMLEHIGCYVRGCNTESISVWESARHKLCTLDGVDKIPSWSKLSMKFHSLGKMEQDIFLDLATFDLCGPEEKIYDVDILKAAWEQSGPDSLFARQALGNIRESYGADRVVNVLVKEQMLRSELRTLVGHALRNLRKNFFLDIIPASGSDERSVLVQTNLDDELSTFSIHKVLQNFGKRLSRPLNEKVQQEPLRRLCLFEDAKYILHQSKEEVPQNKILEVLSVARRQPDHVDSSSKIQSTIKWSSIGRFEALRWLRMSSVKVMEADDPLKFPKNLNLLHMIDCSGPQQRNVLPRRQPDHDWPIREENVDGLHQLSVLLLDNCSHVRLPENFQQLRNLRILRIHCHGADTMQLPEEFGFLDNLEQLSLSAPLEKLPDSFLNLKSLRSCKIWSCLNLKEWPCPRTVERFAYYLASLRSLELADLPALVSLPDDFGGMRHLQNLRLIRCSALKVLPEGFSGLQDLKRLHIQQCVRLEGLCESFHKLTTSQRLDDVTLHDLDALRVPPNLFASLQYLPQGNDSSLPYRQKLSIVRCPNLQELPNRLSVYR